MNAKPDPMDVCIKYGEIRHFHSAQYLHPSDPKAHRGSYQPAASISPN